MNSNPFEVVGGKYPYSYPFPDPLKLTYDPDSNFTGPAGLMAVNETANTVWVLAGTASGVPQWKVIAGSTSNTFASITVTTGPNSFAGATAVADTWTFADALTVANTGTLTASGAVVVSNGGNTNIATEAVSTTPNDPTATGTELISSYIFTGFTTAAAGTIAFVITHASIVISTPIMVTVAATDVMASGARITVNNIVIDTGQVTINTTNSGAGAFDASDEIVITLWILS